MRGTHAPSEPGSSTVTPTPTPSGSDVDADAEPQLARKLGLTSAITITVGSVIGSGIFLKPLDVAQNLATPFEVYAAWAALGVLCLFGAFAYAEMGAMYPEAGGQYAFLREGWGRFVGFLYGWTFLLVINTGTIAALAVAFGDQLATAEVIARSYSYHVAIAMILALAVVNHLGVNWGAILQNVSTFAKLGALAAIVAGGVLLTTGTTFEDAGAAAAARPAAPLPATATLVGGLVAIFWAYEGWHQLPFNAAEMKRPERDLPRGLIWGVLLLIVTYVVVNAVYMHVVPLDEMRTLAEKEQVPMLTVDRIFGGPASLILAALICLSVFGAANPNLLSSPRAFYAMAQDRLLPRPMMHVSPRWRTPTVSIWVQAIWAALLVTWMWKDPTAGSGTFQDITSFVIFAALLFYGITVAAVFVLRRRHADRPRPYRCTGYPVTPALFVVGVLLVDANMLLDAGERDNALKGLLIIASGVPLYLFMTWRAHRLPRAAS